ncbi:helix-turn-helix domain-containing protein [Xanthomonas arboricola]|uniref:helix-turn-helix domain-containing protein n=1 Tax=Xanthomonas arboricola TaxID=56448 RepID=UPI00143105AC|nr:helix-turn-helix transcriptional regulator [Xanthomonas arboricola]NJB80320.1 transcriptional regulator with XRE-family HTH domain [Xanthomonas arboricola]
MAKQVHGPFGSWLREWRRDNRYSLQQFAEKSGLSKVALFELEHGKTFNPRRSTIMAISKATGIAFTKVAILAATQKMQEPA